MRIKFTVGFLPKEKNCLKLIHVPMTSSSHAVRFPGLVSFISAVREGAEKEITTTIVERL